MKTKHKNNTASSDGIPRNRCLSCGTTENMRRRKYCSVECRQQLRYHLNLRTGLLRALNTRYATFYFTEAVIILDVLPYGSAELFSYIFPRSTHGKPVDDFKIEKQKNSIHVLNAPSPAATASLAIGEYINEIATEHFKLRKSDIEQIKKTKNKSKS